MRYMTESPKTMRHSRGCGLTKGPLGKAKAEMMRKKTKTPHKPANTLALGSTSSSLRKAVTMRPLMASTRMADTSQAIAAPPAPVIAARIDPRLWVSEPSGSLGARAGQRSS